MGEFLHESDWEILDSPDGDPKKRGTIKCAEHIRLNKLGVVPPPPAGHPLEHSGLLVAKPTTNLRVVRDIGTGLAELYPDPRDLAAARDSLRESGNCT